MKMRNLLLLAGIAFGVQVSAINSDAEALNVIQGCLASLATTEQDLIKAIDFVGKAQRGEKKFDNIENASLKIQAKDLRIAELMENQMPIED